MAADLPAKGAVEGSRGFAGKGRDEVLRAAEDVEVEVDLDVVLGGGFVSEGSGAIDVQAEDNVGGCKGGGNGTGVADKDERGVRVVALTKTKTKEAEDKDEAFVFGF
ncbi:hypothetical protein ACOSP7_003978 [Xanthoceras sorbifolium]